MSASWPTAVATDSGLYLAVNELQTNLSGAINNAVTTIGLNSTTNFPTVGIILIDNEIIKYTGVSGLNLTGCTRAFDSTTAASHNSAAIVSFAFCATHHNVLKDEIEAIETYLSSNIGTGSQPLSNGSRALASNGSGKITESSVTSTELGYVSGVTSAIQTQLTAKAPAASPTFSGTITTALTANRALTTGAAGVLAVSATTDTELGYVSGVTSAIQTQINGKATTTGITSWTPTINNFGTTGSLTAKYLNVGGIVHCWVSFQAGTLVGSTASITLPVNINSGIPAGTFLGYTCNSTAELQMSNNDTKLVFCDGSTFGSVFFADTGSGASSILTKLNGNTMGHNSNYFSMFFSYPA